MANKDLSEVLDFYGKKIKGQVFNLKKEKKTLFELIKTKEELYEEYIERIKSNWDEFKLKNQERVIKKTFTSFLYQDFDDYFKFFIHNFFGLDQNSLEMVIKEKLSDTNLIIEYNYHISPVESELFDQLSKKIEGNLYSSLTITGYLFFVVSVLGIIIRESIQEKILISLDGAIAKKNDDSIVLNFMILIRNSKENIFKNYINMTLYYFLKQFKGVPEDYYEKLLTSREALYEIALKEYPNTKEKLVDLLYYFYKKCKLLQNFCPLLDFLNFVCSRVEDSTFSKIEIIKKEFLSNFNYTEQKKNSIIRIFKFLDQKSTLYSTFQANNLPTPKAQFNLFLLLMKYYFATGLEALEVGDLLYLPEIFKTQLNQHSKLENNNAIGAKSIKNIDKFITFFSILSSVKDINLFFEKIFNMSVSKLNYKFFRTFLKSYNTRLANIIEEENKILSENPENELFTFNVIVDHICRILYVLIEKIFLRDTPGEASQNFIDPRSRYVARNIALRVLELFIFQEINFSDDIWPEYLISIYRDEISKNLDQYIQIPEKNFYSDLELARFLTIYPLQSFSKENFFEEWLINDIIIPLNKFISNIKNSVRDPSNKIDVYEKLTEIMLEGIEDKEIIQDFKYICQQLAEFWAVSE